MREAAKAAAAAEVSLSSLSSTLPNSHSQLPLSLPSSLSVPLQDSRRMLHAVYRVGDMDDSIAYYRDTLGMKLLRFRDIKEVSLIWWS